MEKSIVEEIEIRSENVSIKYFPIFVSFNNYNY